MVPHMPFGAVPWLSVLPPAAALATAAAAALLGRAALGLGAALCVGWALLAGVGSLPQAAWAPRTGTAALLAPAAVSLALAGLLAWRPRRPRLVLGADAAFAGWWLATHGVLASEFWRVWIVAGLLAPIVGRVGAGRADRLLALTATWWGALLASGGPSGPACVAMAAAAGLLFKKAPAASLASAPLAALCVAADLASGRLAQGRVGAVDVACLAGFVGPFLAEALAGRLRWSGRLRPAVSAAAAAALLSAGAFLFRRAAL